MNDDALSNNDNIKKDYKSWKESTPYLYDILFTKCLEWPSLTINWLKSSQSLSNLGYNAQSLLLGTQTSDQENNHLLIAEVKIPNKSSNNFSSIKNKIEVRNMFNHEGDVNKARINPFNENLIATKSSNGSVYIFNKDIEKESSNDYILKLSGHTQEGYGLSWSKCENNILISGSYDNLICLWDIESQSDKSPLITYSDHENLVEDVCASYENKNIFYSVSDDFTLKTFDLREKKCVSSVKAHGNNVNSLDINPINKFLLLTGSSDCTIGLWDIRNLSEKIYFFDFHEKDVLTVKWNPKYETVFASCSLDRKINLWDISKIATIQSVSDCEDGPPELIFVHAGHISKPNDFDWNPNDEGDFMIASVEEENNNLQVYQIAASAIPPINEDQIILN